MIVLQAASTHTPHPKSLRLVLAGEVRMRLAALRVICKNTKVMGALTVRVQVVGAPVARTWKARMVQKVKAPTMKALAARVGKPAVKMRSQEVGVGVAAVPQSLMEKLQRPSQTNHHSKLPQRWTTRSCRLPQSPRSMTRIQRMNRKAAAMNSHAP